MEKKEWPFDERLEQLLRQKSFAQLSEAEKAEVLKLLTSEEYDEYHQVLQGSSQLFAQPSAGRPPATSPFKAALAQNRSKANTNRLINQSIAVWKAALAVAATALLFLYVGQSRGAQLAGEPVYIYVTDTIVLDKPSKPQLATSPNAQDSSEDGMVMAAHQGSLNASNSYADSSGLKATFASYKSRSLTADRELMDFLVEMH